MLSHHLLTTNRVHTIPCGDLLPVAHISLIVFPVFMQAHISQLLYEHRCATRLQEIPSTSQKGHFKGMPFHRVIKHYVIQGGDVHELGAAEDWTLTGKTHSKLDISPKHEAFMPKSKPDNKGFELFITTAPIPDLNDKLVVFGRVIKGGGMLSSGRKITSQGWCDLDQVAGRIVTP